MSSVLYVIPPLDADVRWILGQPNFACAGLAELLRLMGYVIPRKAEEEQAAFIHWALCLYAEYGPTFRAEGERRFNALKQLLGGA